MPLASAESVDTVAEEGRLRPPGLGHRPAANTHVVCGQESTQVEGTQKAQKIVSLHMSNTIEI